MRDGGLEIVECRNFNLGG